MLASKAITALDRPCWMLVDADGKPHESYDDNVPHFDTKQQAEDSVAEMFRWHDEDEDGPRPVLTPTELDTPCLVLRADCGYVLDEDGDGICHQDDRQVLFDWAMGSGYLLLADGAMLCGPEQCDHCKDVLRTEFSAIVAGKPYEPPPADPTVVQPIDGQLDIDGGMVNLGETRRLRDGGEDG